MSARPTTGPDPTTTAVRGLDSTRLTCGVALVPLAGGQLVGYLVLTAAPNPGIAATAVLPLLAAAAVVGLRGPWGPLAALAVVATIIGTRTVELPFDLARPEATSAFVFALLQLATCGVAAVTASVLLLRGRSGRVGSAAAVALGLVAAVGAGGALLVLAPQDDTTAGLSGAEIAALPTVSMVDYRFEPAQLRVPAGRPLAVRLTNDGIRPHVFAVESLGIQVEVPSGRTRTVVVEVPPGTYELVCPVGDHQEEGMTGRVVVLAEGEDGQDVPTVQGAPQVPADRPETATEIFGHAGHGGPAGAQHDHASGGSGRG